MIQIIRGSITAINSDRGRVQSRSPCGAPFPATPVATLLTTRECLCSLGVFSRVLGRFLEVNCRTLPQVIAEHYIQSVPHMLTVDALDTVDGGTLTCSIRQQGP